MQSRNACNRLQHDVMADSQNVILLLQLIGEVLQIGYVLALHCKKAVALLNAGAGCNPVILLDEAHEGFVRCQRAGTGNAHK